MIRTDKRMRICICLLICILAFIWGNSLMPGSVSQAISGWLKSLLAPFFPGGPETADSDSHLLRKLAHFTEFSALGATLGWLFGMLKKGKLRPFLLGVLAASVDETIQFFVPDRGPGIKDVLLDSCGIAAGIILLYLGHTYLKKLGGQVT